MARETLNGGLVTVFDLDNTLVDSNAKLKADFVGAMLRLGITLKSEEMREDWYKVALRYGFQKEQFDKAFDQRRTWEESLRDGEVPLFQDTLPCLENLASRGVRMAVLSKSIPSYTQVKLDHFDIGRYFERVLTVHPKEPNKREGALKIIEQLDPRTIKTAYFIGDKPEDVVIARDVYDAYATQNLNTSGLYLNRKGAEIPQEVKDFQAIRSLEEVPGIVGI